MMDSPNNVHVVMPKELRDRLKARARPHQALAGVIEELLDYKDNTETSITANKKAKSIPDMTDTID